jgi:hypothetical protein
MRAEAGAANGSPGSSASASTPAVGGGRCVKANWVRNPLWQL